MSLFSFIYKVHQDITHYGSSLILIWGLGLSKGPKKGQIKQEHQ